MNNNEDSPPLMPRVFSRATTTATTIVVAVVAEAAVEALEAVEDEEMVASPVVGVVGVAVVAAHLLHLRLQHQILPLQTSISLSASLTMSLISTCS